VIKDRSADSNTDWQAYEDLSGCEGEYVRGTGCGTQLAKNRLLYVREENPDQQNTP